MNRIANAALALLFPCAAMAQPGINKDAPVISFGVDAPFRLDWDPQPKLHKLPDSLSRQSAALLLDRRQEHYKQDGREMYVYHTVHRVFRLFDAKGVESFNTLTIPVGEGRSMERLKARTILPNGKVINVPQEKFRIAKGEGGAREHLIAFEGVGKGAEVEYFFTEKRPLSLFGTEVMQWVIPVLETEVSFIVPEPMKFEFKGYNGYPSPQGDSMKNGQRVYRVSYRNLPPLKQEEYSNYESGLMRLDYKLSFLTEKPLKRMFTWDDLAERLYEQYYTYTGKEEKTISRYLKSIGVDDDDDESQKVRKIEAAVKTGIVISGDVADEEYRNFDVILEKKLSTEQGFTRFLTACLQVAGVNNQLGLTSDFSEHPLDPDFENWSTLDHYLIYLPTAKAFIDPANIYTRYPILPPEILHNKGAFCKVSGRGREARAKAVIRTIDPLPLEQSGSNIDADISFSQDDMTPEIHFRHMFTGYPALGLRPLFVTATKDKMKELAAQFVSVAEKADDISAYTIGNKALSAYATNLPLIVDADVRSPHLMEKAGPKYIFKLGEVIGRQTQMYNENKRVLPIRMDYPHSFIRHLNITIPDGYTVKNPDAVRFNVVHGKANAGIGFVSDYTMTGNVMAVTIREYYSEVAYPVAEYEAFRKVINAAADFNKVVLILEKKR